MSGKQTDIIKGALRGNNASDTYAMSQRQLESVKNNYFVHQSKDR